MKLKRDVLAERLAARFGERVTIAAADGSELEIERGVIALS
jgi:hypothetical protein